MWSGGRGQGAWGVGAEGGEEGVCVGWREGVCVGWEEGSSGVGGVVVRWGSGVGGLEKRMGGCKLGADAGGTVGTVTCCVQTRELQLQPLSSALSCSRPLNPRPSQPSIPLVSHLPLAASRTAPALRRHPIRHNRGSSPLPTE